MNKQIQKLSGNQLECVSGGMNKYIKYILTGALILTGSAIIIYEVRNRISNNKAIKKGNKYQKIFFGNEIGKRS